ncbi:EAL domain-containing protein [Aliivibrio fischeri]|uniref:putative bifunctional diguanylate cyclase/phosphodiesterase n=1 Tax=Aliivibrio fischeri TaxID=668 RepID=UPI0012D8D75F|nr:GGDEF domain-containing phosphodiesterase [Aliivibrio fischeri]MUK61842.1 EAL domain-containing protein [Aliivibrio fischeri]MUL21887.1 EAL domain-containing protein [Aliivibrio fischeri]MUL25898.1 EAL domain-containing protein [Aliivibrio fischeri]
MDNDVILKLLLFANVVSLVLLSKGVYDIIKNNVLSKKILTSILLLIYFIGFIYIENYLLEKGIKNNIDLSMLISVTFLTQLAFVFILVTNKIKQNISNQEQRNNATNKSKIYRTAIEGRIESRIPFNLTKIKIQNHRTLIEYSSGKTFNSILSYASLLIKKHRNDRNVSIFHDNNEILIIGNLTNKDKINSIALEVYELLIQPIKMKGKNFILQPIIGNVIYSDDIDCVDEMLKRVDIACYKAKKLGLVIDFYSENYAQSINDEVNILSKLVHAIPNKEFELYYQPIVNTMDKTLHGYEALIRWPQKDGSMIPPDKFISIAEKNNYIKGITQWVVSQVTLDIIRLRNDNLNFQVHINISTLDLYDDDLYNQLFDMVANKHLEPSSMILEVTESALMSDVDAAYLMLSKLSELGFYISIDDFGTGYSSLSLLRILAFNQIKIDQSFIRNMAIGNSDYAIVASTIYLAHSLGCNVVAEGVEDEHLFSELQELGCDYVQGYYISKPLDIDSIINWSLKLIEREKMSAIA